MGVSSLLKVEHPPPPYNKNPFVTLKNFNFYPSSMQFKLSGDFVVIYSKFIRL